jgi:hypothetical protein
MSGISKNEMPISFFKMPLRFFAPQAHTLKIWVEVFTILVILVIELWGCRVQGMP